LFPLNPLNYLEILAFLTSVILWPKLKSTRLCWFIPFLLLIVVVELIGRYYSREIHQSNAWLYNLSVPIEYLFYSFLFYQYFISKKFKTLAAAFLVLFPAFAIINYLFIQDSARFNTNFLKVGSLFMFLFAALYFVDFLRIDKVLTPLKQPFFWIASGILLFNAGEFVYNVFFEFYFKNWEVGLKHFRDINNTLNYVLFSCIIIGLISVLWHQEE